MSKSYALQHQLSWQEVVGRIFLLILCLFGFLFSLQLIESLFRGHSEMFTNQFGQAFSNPLLGLCLGLLATATVQSSSTTTALIVATVASGTLQLSQAVPMVMGANVGTTITAMLVAFTHVYNKRQFRKAFAAALGHHFFNILTLILLFPMEYAFGLLSGTAMHLAALFSTGSGEGQSFLYFTIKPLLAWFEQQTGGSVLIPLFTAVALLPASVFGFSAVLKGLVIGSAQQLIEDKVFGQPLIALFWGIGLTALVRSSAATTSLTIPLVAGERISLKKCLPFIMGANVGTTITALLASVSRSETAVSIAITHLLFNLIGVLVVFPFPNLRQKFVWLVKRSASKLTTNRSNAFLYLLLIFFVLPVALLYFGLK